ncbi:hypothetical protein BC832DRAFT_40189 [Gaertneriomyces semiglobifer]|nr:hypothetical protein BC832DRAFT_40189 [Gaertneriomyces semiglobifer]
MSGTQWRQFGFFEAHEVTNPDSSDPPTWLQDLDVTCSSSGRSHLFLGDSAGQVTVLSQSLEIVYQFQAHESKVTHLQCAKQRNAVVTVGEEPGGEVLRVWNLDKMDKASGKPVLVKEVEVTVGGKVFPVTAVSMLQNLTQIAVGLENGVVLLIRGGERSSKTKVLLEGSEMITGLAFYENGKQTMLYVVTLVRILTVDTGNKDVQRTIDSQGAEVGTVAMMRADAGDELVVGRQEAVYFYALNGRGPCFIIEGEKSRLTFFRTYLAIVSRDSSAIASANLSAFSSLSDNEQSPVADNAISETPAGTVLTLYDLKNKFVAFSGTFGEGYRGRAIKAVEGEWGELFVITDDRKMYRLQEKDMDTKLDILFSKNMYNVAINLASQSTLVPGEDTKHADGDQGTLMEIYKRYGDHLYARSEFDAAMTQYLRTIGHLEPSYVIRKFLDAQRIHNLTSYLQALHEHKLANIDHTTLLLNCYTKLGDSEKLDRFIKNEKGRFDVETVIRVCRQSGYAEQALWLAQEYGEHEWYLRIQVDDLHRYDDIVAFLSKLDKIEAVRCLRKHGYALAGEVPREMTDIFVDLCTDVVLDANGEPETAAMPEEFIHFYVGRPSWCVKFLERILEKRWGVVLIGKGRESDVRTSPFQRDSEAERRSMMIVCITLVELYLNKSQLSADDDAETTEIQDRQWKERAMSLLRNPDVAYDTEQALVLCKQHEFQEAALYLYQRMSLYQDMIRQHMRSDDYAEILMTCQEHGNKDPNLWVEALGYFAEKSPADDTERYLQQVLTSIDQKNLLPPLQVIQILSRNPSITVGMVRSYISKRVSAEQQAISESKKMIASYREETKKMKKELEDLKTKPLEFKSTKCEVCQQPLDIPSVHYMCRHGYHARCVGDEEECRVCAPEYRMVKELIRSQEAVGGKYEVFAKKLEASEDRFSVIAEWFGKNAFANR